jgi:hypothetical protein
VAVERGGVNCVQSSFVVCGAGVSKASLDHFFGVQESSSFTADG